MFLTFCSFQNKFISNIDEIFLQAFFLFTSMIDILLIIKLCITQTY